MSDRACGRCGSTKRLYDGEIKLGDEWVWLCVPCLREVREAPVIDPNQGSLL